MKKKTEKIGNRVEAMDFVGKTIVRNKMKPFDELTFSDSFLFGEAMMDETVCKDVLEIILGIVIAKVVILEKEKQESNIPEQKSIRMDIYVEDEENTVYNVEMQVEDKKDTPKRSRYYQGLLDSKLLPAGSKSYNLLNKSFVIFICHFDPFGEKRCCYTFEERCLENLNLPLGDGTQKIFLSTVGENKEELSPVLVEFLEYLKNPRNIKIKSEKIANLNNRVEQIKIDAKVRSRYMTLKEWLDDMVEKEMEEWTAAAEEAIRTEGHEEGKRESEVGTLRKLYQKGFDATETADILDLDKTYVSIIYELLQKYPEREDGQIASMYLQKIENMQVKK